ncbi:MAG TPA: S26 family signal peptidase [Tepidisphaeraceae bacterium]|nr:S26 family signal peptidase [Tepidisphaeraceae bacterium]
MDDPQPKLPGGQSPSYQPSRLASGSSSRPVPPVVVPPPPPPATTTPPPPEKENIKETIESILVAFILAFVFRAFVVEAFVIPSGSMAPTLLGGHLRFRCEECGYQFDVNYPSNSQDENITIPSMSGPRRIKVQRRRFDGATEEIEIEKPTSLSMHCPNCGFKVPRVRSDPYLSATNSPVHYGDRILVLKYLYEIQPPKRWDVVVFKTPTERGKYETNFIKRLAGRPGEALLLLDGDVYVAPSETPQEKRQWEVQNKPRAVQEALWRIIYDNDFYPLNADPERQARPFVLPWQQTDGSGWTQPAKNEPMRVLTFNNASGAGKLTFNKDASKRSARAWLPLTDWLPYNETKMADPRRDADYYTTDYYADEMIPYWYVSDLKLHFFYDRKSGDGTIRATLTKLDHAFTAEITPDHARVVHRLPDGSSKVIGEADLKFAAGAPLEVEFQNVDYQVTLRVSRKDVIRTTPEQYKPDVADLLLRHEKRMGLAYKQESREKIRSVFPAPTVDLTAEKQTCEISHLSLWRDVYYTPTYEDYQREISQGSPRRPIVLNKAGKGADGKIYENEYFVLGDNSILSGDARSWVENVDLALGEDLEVEGGRVPERFLLGRAFFVYWPAGYRPFSPGMPGLIPNFGEMRFIH